MCAQEGLLCTVRRSHFQVLKNYQNPHMLCPIQSNDIMFPLLMRRRKLSKPSRQNIFINHCSFYSSPGHYANCSEINGRDWALSPGKALHAHLITTGLVSSSTYLTSKLINFYVRCERIDHARKVFDEIPEPNYGSWVVLIGVYSRQGSHQETIDLFAEMRRVGLKPNKYVLPSVLKACASLSDKKTGVKIHGILVRSLSDIDVFVDSSLIDMYSKCGQVDKARLVFDRMPNKDLVVWNCMVSGYAQQGFASEAMHLVEEMKLVGVKPDLVTWNALIAGFCQVGDYPVALKLFKMMQVEGTQPDVVSWTSVISGFVKNFRYNEAFHTFKHMIASRVMPSSFTISSLLPACATVADLKHGKEIHGYALVIGVAEDVFVCSSLVDMYAKCACLFEAETLFSKISMRSTVSWNAMIFGYANHGCFDEALDLFGQMVEKEKVKPDHLTFTAALTACTHAGMVEVGCNLFHLMQEEHGIEPRLEHYACMVDILGRAGRLTEAYTLITDMPIEPNSFVWGALLGACRNHGNIELAEIAAKCLHKLEPRGSGSSLLLSNLYADAGNWGQAERLKKITRRRRLRRNTGCSWIEIV